MVFFQMAVEFAFSAEDSLKTAETFKMGLPHIGDQSVIRQGDRTKECDLPGVVGAHFHHAEVGFVGHAEQGQGDTDMVVEVTLGKGDPEFPGEYGGHQLLGGGFSVGAGDGQYGEPQAGPVIACQFL